MLYSNAILRLLGSNTLAYFSGVLVAKEKSFVLLKLGPLRCKAIFRSQGTDTLAYFSGASTGKKKRFLTLAFGHLRCFA